MIGAFGEVLVLDWGVAKIIRNAKDGGPAPLNSLNLLLTLVTK